MCEPPTDHSCLVFSHGAIHFLFEYLDPFGILQAGFLLIIGAVRLVFSSVRSR